MVQLVVLAVLKVTFHFDYLWATALAVSSNSVIAGGTFATINGAVSLSVAKLDAVTGARDDSFPAQAGLPGNPLSVARQEDGKVIVAGGGPAGTPRRAQPGDRHGRKHGYEVLPLA